MCLLANFMWFMLLLSKQNIFGNIFWDNWNKQRCDRKRGLYTLKQDTFFDNLCAWFLHVYHFCGSLLLQNHNLCILKYTWGPAKCEFWFLNALYRCAMLLYRYEMLHSIILTDTNEYCFTVYASSRIYRSYS